MSMVDDPRSGLYFDDLNIGDRFYFGNKQIDHGEIANYRSISPRYGKELSEYSDSGDQKVPNLVILLASHGLRHIGGTPHRRPGGGFYGIDDIKWEKQISVGDYIYVYSEISKKEDYKSNIGKLTYTREVKDDDDNLIMMCDLILLAQKKDD